MIIVVHYLKGDVMKKHIQKKATAKKRALAKEVEGDTVCSECGYEPCSCKTRGLAKIKKSRHKVNH